ncbi:response regulator [Pararoseomonas indoligenes]|uniref:Response regulator n=1 Tax=Roseomonas indoligenes TaxID=2820811 RepID=A0A940MZT4_9PROT|nr:response regulator [Pararoseomonas indoligenes]MBP0495216.1 response regulator [Pararoseomonas indoligenes]
MCDVLVLEDDDLVLDVMVQALEDAGYAVRMAEHGDEALEYLASGPCRLMLSDINLGEPMNGFDVVERARAARPDLKVIYLSGMPSNWAGRAFDERTRRLNKPFRFEELLRAIQEMGVWPSQPPALGVERSTF